jgi:16S rRNA processing protein RimM
VGVGELARMTSDQEAGSASGADRARWLHAGIVGAPHGLDGSFHVRQANPGLLAEGMPVMLGPDRHTIETRRGHDRRVILRVDGCASRESARALVGRELLVARTLAPELGPDEWWAEELEGCVVRDREVRVGIVTRLLALPSCEVLEVERPGSEPVLLVPLVSDAVRDVDLLRGVIDIDLGFLGER